MARSIRISWNEFRFVRRNRQAIFVMFDLGIEGLECLEAPFRI
jgi:hypothetical protein